MIRVGIGLRDYNSYRAFHGALIEDVQFVHRPYLPVRQIAKFVGGLTGISEGATFFLPIGGVDLYHTFNSIPLSRKPWIVSAESLLPRTWNKRAASWLFSRLARDECRKILPLSENGLLHICRRNSDHPRFDEVIQKTRVLYPAIDDYPEFFAKRCQRFARTEIQLLFVGNDFFRKGGDIAVTAYEALRTKYPIRMTVISTMKEENYVFPTQPGSADRWRRKMCDLGIEHKESVPFRVVREIMADSDLVLLPTLDDSFGYSIVEAMATGVVPIATAIRAVPEMITHRKDGFLCEVPITEEGRLDLSRIDLSQLAECFTETLRSALDCPEALKEMGVCGRETYERRFSQQRLAAELHSIYQEVCF